MFRFVPQDGLLLNILILTFRDSNVPGVAMYMTSLSQFRALLASSPYFVSKGPQYQAGGSVLPKLSNHGNLLAGAVTRVAVGFVLNPFSVLKARYEVCVAHLDSFLRKSNVFNRVACFVDNIKHFSPL